MLQTILIGHLGADAEQKNVNGKQFATFRVAQTDKWTDEAGQTHESTTWVDCVMNGEPKVLPFLKKGTQVFVIGATSLRVYSSAKDRCMKAGLTINVRQIELLGGKKDDFPSEIYSEDGKETATLNKYYHAPSLQGNATTPEQRVYVDKNGGKYVVDKEGWVFRAKEQE